MYINVYFKEDISSCKTWCLVRLFYLNIRENKHTMITC